MATMRHSATVGLLMTVGVALGTAACGPDVPANPDWAVDVRPILQARCVRCHGSHEPDQAGGPPTRIDPLSKDTAGLAAQPFDTVEPLTSALTNMMPARIRGQGPLMIMPPPPAAPLEGWQIDIIANYVKNHP
jgi:mono/diheme cytochrome c family protein